MKTSIVGKKHIQEFEGERLKAYKCSAGKWTISTGLTYYPNGNSVKEGDTITKEQSIKYFDFVLSKFEEGVTRLVGLKIHQLMFDSLVSFAFNHGLEKFKNSTLLKKVNLGKFIEASNEFEKWGNITVNGKLVENKGVMRRKKAERDLFLKGLKELEINEITGKN